MSLFEEATVSKSIRVSLLVPCHNAARFLPDLIKGARHQVVPFAEMLLYDDGSDDNSSEVALQLGLRVISAAGPRGPAIARNALAAAAACEFIHFHDADDLIETSYLQTLVPSLNDDVDVAVCDASWVHADSGKEAIRWKYSQSEYDPDPVAYLLTHPLGVNNCIYRASSFSAAGGFDPRAVPWEDADFNFRLARHGARFAFTPGVHTISRRHDGGISMDYRRNWRARVECLDRYADEFEPRLRAIIAEEAELAAQQLIFHRDSEGTRRAVMLAQTLGRRVPTTKNPVLRIVRRTIPAIWALRIQAAARRLMKPYTF